MLLFSNINNKESNALFTPWTFVHFLSGINLYLFTNIININHKFKLILLIHTIYEIKDFYIAYISNTSNNEDPDYDFNSFLNSIGDTIACILGVLFVRKNGIIKKNSVCLLIIMLFLTMYIASLFKQLKLD